MPRSKRGRRFRLKRLNWKGLAWWYIAARRFRWRKKNYSTSGSQKKRRRRWRVRKRYTLKQRPLLHLFLLHAPWQSARYRLRWNPGRMSRHAQAFWMYYRLKPKPHLRIVKNSKKQPNRVKHLFERFEYRLDVVLVRLGWAKDFRTARSMLNSGFITLRRNFSGIVKVWTACELDRLLPGDKLSIQHKGAFVSKIRTRGLKVLWQDKSSRSLVSLPPRPRGYNRYLFWKYKNARRRLPWLRYPQFFYSQPPHFLVNYNTLVAIFRPDTRLRIPLLRYSELFGPKLAFWSDMLRAS